MFFAPKNLTIEPLLVMVHEIVGVYPNRFVYELRFLFNTDSLTIEPLLVMVHEIVGAYPNRFVYELRFLFNIDGKVVRLNIKNDRDLLCVSRSKCQS